jgi:3-deoxy-D-manno-octulosonic acid (KDO) 8-phosphate synthase
MAQKIIRVGDIEIANDKPMVLFGGMNVLESRDMAMQVCEEFPGHQASLRRADHHRRPRA